MLKIDTGDFFVFKKNLFTQIILITSWFYKKLSKSRWSLSTLETYISMHFFTVEGAKKRSHPVVSDTKILLILVIWNCDTSGLWGLLSGLKAARCEWANEQSDVFVGYSIMFAILRSTLCMSVVYLKSTEHGTA